MQKFLFFVLCGCYERNERGASSEGNCDVLVLWYSKREVHVYHNSLNNCVGTKSPRENTIPRAYNM